MRGRTAARPESILSDPLPRNTIRIELPTNEGTTNSINRGMASVPLPYVLLLNNDVELAPDYLEKLLAALEADETLGFATGKLLRATERTQLDGARVRAWSRTCEVRGARFAKFGQNGNAGVC